MKKSLAENTKKKTEFPSHWEVVTIPEEVLFQNIGEQTIFLSMKTGVYYALNPVGSRFWELLVEKRSVPAAFESMMEEYEVAQEDLQRDILHLVSELQAAYLLDMEDLS
jgi:hypothetical protein